MKLQTKTQNLTLKIQKLARVLNKFTLSDIQQLIPEDITIIKKVIKNLVLDNIVKQLSETEFLYSKIKEVKVCEDIKKDIIRVNSNTRNKYKENEWLTMDEVMAITEEKRETIRRKCKNGKYVSIFRKQGKTKEYLINKVALLKSIKPKHNYHKIEFTYKEFPKITPDDFTFDNEKEQKIYDNAYDYQKKRVKKFVTLFRLTGKLVGKELQEYLERISQENPDLKTSYSTFIKARWRYKKEGIKSLIPKYGEFNKGKSVVSQDMYEDFKKLYLSSNKYSVQTAVEELINMGYPSDILPSHRSFERLLKKEYSAKYIKAQREAHLVIPKIKLDSEEINKQINQQPLFENYIDAANAYLEKYSNDNSEKQICRRGYIKNHLNPYFRKFKFGEITSYVIENFVKIKMAEGYAFASINRFTATLSSIMNEYNIPKEHLMTSSSNLPIMDQQCNILNNEEIEQIIKNDDERLWILCLGVNPAELEAVEYSDIDFNNRTIKIDKCMFNNKAKKFRKFYRIRSLKIPKLLFKNLSTDKKGRIFKQINIANYDILLNTHVKLLLDKNIQINIISKNLGFEKLTDFEKRFQGLLPQQLDDNFEIIIDI